MSEEKLIQATQEEDLDYTVGELIHELMQDDSWEADPEYKGKAIGMLFMSVFPVC